VGSFLYQTYKKWLLNRAIVLCVTQRLLKLSLPTKFQNPPWTFCLVQTEVCVPNFSSLMSKPCEERKVTSRQTNRQQPYPNACIRKNFSLMKHLTLHTLLSQGIFNIRNFQTLTTSTFFDICLDKRNQTGNKNRKELDNLKVWKNDKNFMIVLKHYFKIKKKCLTFQRMPYKLFFIKGIPSLWFFCCLNSLKLYFNKILELKLILPKKPIRH